jgi:hypothetical protein
VFLFYSCLSPFVCTFGFGCVFFFRKCRYFCFPGCLQEGYIVLEMLLSIG